MKKILKFCFLGLAFILLFSGDALAHARSTSFSFWTLDGTELRGRLVFPWIEVEQAFPEWRGARPEDVLSDHGVGQKLSDFFQHRIALPASCSQAPWAPPQLKDGSLAFRMKANCPAGVDVIRFNLTFDVAPSHVHLVRFEREGVLLSGVVTSGARDWDAGSTVAAADTGWRGFIRTGFEHIMGGMDHLFFLAALLLLAPSLGAVLGLATGFTLAHSLSLAVAVFGLAKPDGPTVEALIGFTVAFSALEVFHGLAPRDEAGHRFQRRMVVSYPFLVALLVAASLLGWLHLQSVALGGVGLFTACFLGLSDGTLKWRWLLVFLFGFIHGFGFAGPLLELDMGREGMAKALLGFNLGVEAGQLAFLFALWPVIVGLRKLEPRVPVAAALASTVLAAGTFWFLSRGLF